MPSLLLALSACAGSPIEADTLGGTDASTQGTSGPGSGASNPSDPTGAAEASVSGSASVADSGDTSAGDPSASSTAASTDQPSTGEASSDPTGVPGGCGDGVLDDGEPCDDGNADELDGCTSACAPGPLGFDFSSASTTPEMGGGSTQLYFDGVDDCPAGQVLRGLSGGLTPEGWLGTVRGRCMTMSLTNTDPPTLAFGVGDDLPEHGQFDSGGSWELLCPAGEVLVAAQGRAGDVFDQIELHCSGASLVLGEDDRYALVLGAGTVVGPEGNDGGSLVGPIACDAGSLTTGLDLETNSYFVRVALRCRTVTLEYPS